MVVYSLIRGKRETKVHSNGRGIIWLICNISLDDGFSGRIVIFIFYFFLFHFGSLTVIIFILLTTQYKVLEMAWQCFHIVQSSSSLFIPALRLPSCCSPGYAVRGENCDWAVVCVINNPPPFWAGVCYILNSSLDVFWTQKIGRFVINFSSFNVKYIG